MNLKLVPVDFLPSTKCRDCPIGGFAFCSRCSVSEIDTLEQTKHYKKFRKGDVLVFEGHELTFSASIISGVAQLSQSMPDGRTQVVGMLLPSDIIGNIRQSRASFTVTAASDLLLCSFDRARFGKMIAQTANISQQMLLMKLDELDAARHWMLVLGRKSARERVASFLVYFAQRCSSPVSECDREKREFDLFLTRGCIADFLGLSLETVSRQLAQLKREGIVEFGIGSKFVIPDFRILEIQSGDDADGGVIV